MRIPESEARRVKRTIGRNGKTFRSAKKAIAFCQEETRQAFEVFNNDLDYLWEEAK